MKVNKFATIITIVIIVLVGVIVYKFVIEPVQLKREYVTCVESARAEDYKRWQEVENKIEKQKVIRSQKWKEVDDSVSNYELSVSFERCVEDAKEERCYDENRISFGLCNDLDYFKRICSIKKRHEIEGDAIVSDKVLHGLNEELNANGEILKGELANCEKTFKMLSRSY